MDHVMCPGWKLIQINFPKWKLYLETTKKRKAYFFSECLTERAWGIKITSEHIGPRSYAILLKFILPKKQKQATSTLNIVHNMQIHMCFVSKRISHLMKCRCIWHEYRQYFTQYWLGAMWQIMPAWHLLRSCGRSIPQYGAPKIQNSGLYLFIFILRYGLEAPVELGAVQTHCKTLPFHRQDTPRMGREMGTEEKLAQGHTADE